MGTCVINVDKEGLFMSADAATETSCVGRCFVQAYIWLAHNAAANDKVMYRIRPKLHLFDHDVERLYRWRFNPKSVSCFSDEDFVGRMCGIAISCGHQGI